MQRKIRYGMVGGGRGAFIGAVHRSAAALDGQMELVCGAFSSTEEKSKASGGDLMIAEDRCYGTFEEMILKEKDRPDRMDAVSIVTPNHMHFAPAKLALENGFHVICDKPVTLTVEEAQILQKLVGDTGLVFALTHNYTGYPMVKEARDMVQKGKIGKVRKVVVEYSQGWLSKDQENTGNKQAEWRTDPARSGMGGALGDIGTHAENLAEYITGLEIKELSAEVSTFVEGRLLDDDANLLLRFDSGAKGILHCSQIFNGEENNLNIRIAGEDGSLFWNQMEPNTLVHKTQSSHQIYRTGVGILSAASTGATRVPAGHPEGYLEAFGNIYSSFALAVGDSLEGKKASGYDFPTIADGIRGMKFVVAAIESGNNNAKWTSVI